MQMNPLKLEHVLMGLGTAGLIGYLIWHKRTKTYWPWEKPALRATSITASPETVSVGELTTATATVKNPGREPLSGTLVFTVDGIEIQRLSTGTIAGGEAREFETTYMPGDAGTFSVCAEVT